jgi:hypothetical protein
MKVTSWDRCLHGPTACELFYLEGLLLDRPCGLVVRVSGYRSRGFGFDSLRYNIFWEVVGLEQGTLSLMSITEELLEWKTSGSGSRKLRLTGMGIRCADHVTSSIRKTLRVNSPTGGGPSVAIVCLLHLLMCTKCTRPPLWFSSKINQPENVLTN